MAQAYISCIGLGIKQRLLEIQRAAHQALRDRAAIELGKALDLGQEPGDTWGLRDHLFRQHAV